jgi:hypothetical protein
MVDSTLEQQLVKQFRRLTVEQQRQLLDYAQTMTRPRGLSGREMVALARKVAFPPEDLAEIEQAIKEN